MKTLAILSRKGGTGKTTIAVHLSVAAEQAGHTTALIDLDPQASTVSWSDRHPGDTPVVISAHASRLPDLLEKAQENGIDFAIIDTAAHAETSALAAARRDPRLDTPRNLATFRKKLLAFGTLIGYCCLTL